MTRRLTSCLMALSIALAISSPTYAQARTKTTTGSSLPSNCTVGDIYTKTGSSAGLYRCSVTDTWTLLIASLNLGTGVQSALAIAVGSAGAPVVLNGAGGTPSSINLSNASSFPFATGGTGIVPPANLGTGSSITAKFLRGDGTWQTIAGGGDALVASGLDQFVGVATTTVTCSASCIFKPDTTNAHTLKIQAYDVDGAAYVDAIKITNGNTPALDLLAGTTVGGDAIIAITAPPTATDVGAAATAFRYAYLYGDGTYGSTSLKFTGTPTGNRLITVQDATQTLIGRDTTDTLTNKTFDVEGTGNVFTMVGYTMYTPAVVQGSTATLGMSCLTSLCPTAVSLTGTNVPRAGAQFPDSDGEFHVAGDVAMASDFTGTADFKGQVRFESDTNTGHAFRIQIQWACTASGTVGNDTWSTAATVDVAPDGTTTHYINWSKTGVTLTSCSAGNDFAFRLMRQRTDAADTVTGTVELMPFGMYLRRAQ